MGARQEVMVCESTCSLGKSARKHLEVMLLAQLAGQSLEQGTLPGAYRQTKAPVDI